MMNKFINICLFCIIIFSSSCLKSGLDDLPTYEEANITNIKFEYRWWDDKTNQMRAVELKVDKQIVGDEIACKLTVPATTSSFTQQIRDKVSLSNIVGVMDISVGSSVIPLDGAPKLGSPGDFSKKNFSYQVTAADGKTKKTWDITIESFTK